MNPMQELVELDVSDSMMRNINALFSAMDTIDTKNLRDAKERLDAIHKKVEEIEEYFWRPVDSQEVYERLVQVANELGEKDKSSHYQYQIRLSNANDLEFMGRVQDFYGNKVLAVEYYAKALELIPIHELAGPAHSKAKKSIEKVQHEMAAIEKKLEVHKEDPGLWFKYGMVLLSKGEVKRSIECFDKVIQLDPTNPDAHARRGTAMESLGDYKGAKGFLEKALELKPSSMIAKRGLNYAEYFLEQKTG